MLLYEETVRSESLTPATLWQFSSWNFELNITIPLLALLAMYVIGAVRSSRLAKLAAQHCAFIASWLLLCFALVSPLHELGDQLFSAHMLQHEILILLAAPLLSASHCGVTLLWALPAVARARIGTWLRDITTSRAGILLLTPLTAWMLHFAALWAWHLPPLYQATLRYESVHALQHLSFFVTAVIFWSTLYGAGRSAMSYGAAVIYVFATAASCTALGALLTFSTVLWYPIYAQTTYAWHLTPLQDQQIGGLIMWVPSGLVFIAIGVLLFARWLSEGDTRLRYGSLETTLRSSGDAPHE
jgi:cytochrome c oxidase assembly factor CtaG